MPRWRSKSGNDWRAAVLTDLLPYEVPLPLSNEGFYRFLCGGDEDSAPELVKSLLMKPPAVPIPFTYHIRKGDSEHRKLSLIHPAIQKDLARLYEDHSSLIIDLCSRSPFSLRYPAGIARSYYEEDLEASEPDDQEQSVEAETGAFAPQLPYRTSYFTYQRFPLLHKFHASYEFVALEKRFDLLLEFDIANCFYTIYTHSFAWAVKDKAFSKAHKGKPSFEKTFDGLMQRANYLETNGIVVGPEISRIFAEIILQRVDLDVAKILLLQRPALKRGKDYDVRRYVDDYFVYASDSETLERVFCAFKDELERVNLRVNTGKTRRSRLPFISDQTITKTALSKQLSAWVSGLVTWIPTVPSYAQDASNFTTGSTQIAFKRGLRKTVGLQAITGVKSIVSEHGVGFSAVSDYALGILRNWLAKHTGHSKDEFCSLLRENESTAESMLNSYLDVVFFLYAMDTRVKTTYKVLEILLLLNKVLDNTSSTLMHNIQHRIFAESSNILTKAKRDMSLAEVEILNLLIGMREMGELFLLKEEALARAFGIGLAPGMPTPSLNYFQIVTLLFYCNCNPCYKQIRTMLVESAIEKLRCEKEPFQRADLVYLFFDLVCCPHVTASERNTIVNLAFEKSGLPKIEREINRATDYIRSRVWFFNWEASLDLEGVLKKKVLRVYS